MQFINTFLLAATALASIASAQNVVQFVNQDSVPKTIIFTANAGLQTLDPLSLDGLATAEQVFPDSWLGNFYSVNEGADNVPGMLGEVAFQGFAGATYFDVSSIVNPNDTEGVKQLYPFNADLKSSTAAVSGCNEAKANAAGKTTGCTQQYNAPDDVATVSTPLTSLVCLVGNPTSTVRRRKVEVFSRDYVTGVVTQ